MTYSRYIGIVFSAAVISWAAFLLVFFKLSPYESLGLALTLFFVTLFIALASTFAVIGFYFRLLMVKSDDVYYKHVNVALRQGVFLSLIAVSSLVLQMVRLLNWWSGFLLVGIFVLLEFYFSAKDSDIT